MLSAHEKAYCLALKALKDKDYEAALGQFDRAVEGFADDKEFVLLKESTRLLVSVKEELAGPVSVSSDEPVTKER